MDKDPALRCRVCGAELSGASPLILRGLPKSAQHFPDEAQLAGEKGMDLTAVECPGCGLVQLIGEPVPYYKDVIRATGVSAEMRAFRLAQFRRWVEENGLQDRRVIELGCGEGDYLALMEEAGAEAWGMEHGAEALAAARASGKRVISGHLDDMPSELPGAPYAGFYCMNYLEHMPRPAEYLRRAARFLAEDACGLVEVPSFEMIRRRDMYAEFIQDHLSYFTEDSFRFLLNGSGFEVISLEEIWYGYILSAVVRRRRSASFKGMEKRLEELREQVEAYLRRQKAAGKRVAAWGAGHQALTNLALLEMGAYLECVIDSAPFKQNRFTPATHIPVVAPAVLDSGSIDTVIIMAAGYTEEIRGILERERPGVEIAVLDETLHTDLQNRQCEEQQI